RTQVFLNRLPPGVSPEISELHFLKKSGSPLVLEVNPQVLLEGDRPVGIYAIERDVTEAKQIQQLEADRRRVLETIATGKPIEATLAQIVRLVEGQFPRC